MRDVTFRSVTYNGKESGFLDAHSPTANNSSSSSLLGVLPPSLNVSSERSTLFATRLLRLAGGHQLLVEERVRDILSNPNKLDEAELETRLNHVVVDYLDWLEVARDRLLPKGSFGNGEKGNLYEILDELYSYALNGQWFKPEWFRIEWPMLMRNGSEKLRDAMCFLSGSPSRSNVSICEFQLSDLTDSVTEALADILASRVIDLNKNEPQEGLEWKVTPNEIKDLVSSESTVVHALSVDNKISGLFVLFTDFRKISEGGMDSIREWQEKERAGFKKIAYGYAVAVKQDISEFFHTQDESSYKVILRAVLESAKALGFDALVGRVRVGPRANLAMSKHEALGWKRTGIVRLKKGDPFELVYLPVEETFKDIGAGRTAYEAISGSAQLEELQRFVGDPASISAFEKTNPGEARDANIAGEIAKEFLARCGLNSSFKVEIGHKTLSGEKDDVIIVGIDRQYTFFQKRRGQDEWVPFFAADRRVMTFRECLDVFQQQIKEHGRY